MRKAAQLHRARAQCPVAAVDAFCCTTTSAAATSVADVVAAVAVIVTAKDPRFENEQVAGCPFAQQTHFALMISDRCVGSFCRLVSDFRAIANARLVEIFQECAEDSMIPPERRREEQVVERLLVACESSWNCTTAVTHTPGLICGQYNECHSRK
jgi:hypothetical protein